MVVPKARVLTSVKNLKALKERATEENEMKKQRRQERGKDN